MKMPRALLVTLLLASGLATPAVALSSCTLTLSTSGKFMMAADGLSIGTEETGGLAAAMLVVGLNLTPKLTFSALSVVGPTGWAGAPVGYMSVVSLNGTRQPYTASAFTMIPGVLLDTLTFNARIVNPAGFKAGNYSATSTVTCEAA